jgi:hypothetical protein
LPCTSVNACTAMVGSKQRVETYRARADAGLDLFSESDSKEHRPPEPGYRKLRSLGNDEHRHLSVRTVDTKLMLGGKALIDRGGW